MKTILSHANQCCVTQLTRARISKQLSVVIPQFYTTITSCTPTHAHGPTPTTHTACLTMTPCLAPIPNRSRSPTNLELRATQWQLRVEFRIPELLINVRQCLQFEEALGTTGCESFTCLWHTSFSTLHFSISYSSGCFYSLSSLLVCLPLYLSPRLGVCLSFKVFFRYPKLLLALLVHRNHISATFCQRSSST